MAALPRARRRGRREGGGEEASLSVWWQQLPGTELHAVPQRPDVWRHWLGSSLPTPSELGACVSLLWL